MFCTEGSLRSACVSMLSDQSSLSACGILDPYLFTEHLVKTDQTVWRCRQVSFH